MHYIKFSYLILLFLPLFLGCNQEGQKTLPPATGHEYQILVVTDDFSPGEEFQEKVKEAFFVPFPALPSTENWFNLQFIGIGNFSMIHQRNSHIIFLSPAGDQGRVSRYMRNVFSEEGIQKMFSSPDSLYLKREDVWSSPQLVTYLAAGNTEQLLHSIHEKKENILAQFDRVEQQRIKSKVYASKGSTGKIKVVEGVEIKIPVEYRKAIHKDKPAEDTILNYLNIERFTWFRNEAERSSTNILMYSQPFEGNHQFTRDYIIALRDSVTKYHIPGPSLESYVAIEKEYEPDTRVINYHGNYAVETRGLWKLEGPDFMGGPFINYTIYDEVNQKVITLSGFVFAPQISKKNLVKRVELIITAR